MKVSLKVNLEEELYRKLTYEAFKQGISTDDVATQIIENYLRENEDEFKAKHKD